MLVELKNRQIRDLRRGRLRMRGEKTRYPEELACMMHNDCRKKPSWQTSQPVNSAHTCGPPLHHLQISIMLEVSEGGKRSIINQHKD